MSLEDKMRELLVKNEKERKKEKKKRKIIDQMIGQKLSEIFALCRSVSWQS